MHAAAKICRDVGMSEQVNLVFYRNTRSAAWSQMAIDVAICGHRWPFGPGAGGYGYDEGYACEFTHASSNEVSTEVKNRTSWNEPGLATRKL